ncbi:MAG: MoaD/ThiS family protein [Syntrophorhabdaceae bacterium]|nr:MoaD/ThiS family protein [Syntrophorhabdaceae bacterium]
MAHKKEIEVVINGIKELVPEDITIAGLIELYNEKDIGLIVEQNNRYVFPQRYGSTIVKHGDKIEFINPDFGG